MAAHLSTANVLAAVRALIAEHQQADGRYDPQAPESSRDSEALYLLAGLTRDAIEGGGIRSLARALRIASPSTT